MTIKLFFIIVFSIYLTACGSSEVHERINTITVEVTGDEFNWYFRYPGEDGKLGTADDKTSMQNLYLPDNANVTLDLKSKDYVYNFALPDVSKKEIAVPDLAFNLKFKTNDTSTWVLLGDQFCGFSHETLIGKVYIRDQSSNHFYDW